MDIELEFYGTHNINLIIQLQVVSIKMDIR